MRKALAVAALLLAPAARAAAAPGVSSGTVVDGLLDEFYSSTFTLAAVRARAEGVLADAPDDSRAHEVSAYAALLAAEPDEAWSHFLKAAAGCSGPMAALYLRELSALEMTETQRKATRALLGELRARHPLPDVRALAAYELAGEEQLSGRTDEALRLYRGLGFIEEWLLLGSLDNDQGKGFNTAYPPENAVKLDAEVPGAYVPVRWRPWKNQGAPGGPPLGSILFPNEFGLAYLLTYLHSDSARKASLRLTTGSPTKVWWNDRLALSKEKVSPGGLDNLSLPVTLAKGWNKLLVKSAHRKGRWWLEARLTGPDGEPLPDLRASAEPQSSGKDAAAASTEPAAPPSADGVEPAGRRLFLDGRLRSLAGLPQKAVESASDFLAQAPGNPLAQYYAALYYQKTEELGKAIDLLDKAVRASEGRIAGLLLERARYYQEKRLFQKAQDDLGAALALTPKSRSAQRALAELYRWREWTIDQCGELESLLKEWPDDAPALRDLGSCWSALGYADRAQRTLAKAGDAAPGSVATLRRRFDLALRRSDFAAAGAFIAAIRRLEPNDPEPLSLEAELSRVSGAAAKAAGLLRRAAEMAPTWALPYRRLGDLAYEAGDKDEALRQWKLALARDSGNSGLAQHIEFLEPLKLGWIGGLIPGDDEIETALTRTVVPHPASFGAMLLDHTVTEVQADGSFRSVVTEVYRAFNEAGRDSLIMCRVPTGAGVQILRAYAVAKDGERQEASSIRGGEVRFRNLEVGASVVLQYVDHNGPPVFLKGNYFGEFYFQAVGWQYEDSRWIVSVPKDRRLTTFVSPGVDAQESVEDGRRVYRYRARGVPPIPREPFMPAAADLARQAVVSTLDGWDEFVRWQRGLLVDAFEDNPKLKELAARLTKGAATPRERLDLIFHSVAEDVRYQQDYENTVAGVRPHPPSVVVERGYGDCKDKASLLIGLAKLVGIKAQFVLLRTTPNGRLRQEVPNAQFDHAIVYIPKQKGFGKDLFLDPTADRQDMGVLREDDQGAVGLVIDPAGKKWRFVPIPYQAPEFQVQKHDIEIRVKSAAEASLSDALTFKGRAARSFRYMLSNRTEAQKDLEAFAGAFLRGSTLQSWTAEGSTDTWHPLSLTVELDISNALQSEQGRLRIPLPRDFPLDGADETNAREDPLRFGAPDVYSSSIRLRIPDGWSAEQTPRDFSVADPCFTARRRGSVRGRLITLEFSFRRRCPEMTAAEYPPFRKAVKEVKKQLDAAIVLAEAPAR